MIELESAVFDETIRELERANEKHGPAFASFHEAYAVIHEEVDETLVEVKEIESLLDKLWWSVKVNRTDAFEEYAYRISRRAMNAASEAIQVAAMCRKAINSIDHMEGKE